MTAKRPPAEDPQLPLDLPQTAAPDLSIVRTPAAAEAIAALSRWKDWPEAQMALIGPPSSGKTLLAADWARRVGAWLVSGDALSKADMPEIHERAPSGVAVDDADASPTGDNLLAAINLCREFNAPLLLTGASDPASWALEPADLRSRLGAAPTVHIAPADDVTLDLLLVAACRHRFMKLPPDTSRYIVKRLAAGYEAVEPVADALAAAAKGRALTRAAARRALEGGGVLDLDEEGGGHGADG